MANKNRKDQNQSSAKNKSVNNQNNNTANAQFTDTKTNDNFEKKNDIKIEKIETENTSEKAKKNTSDKSENNAKKTLQKGGKNGAQTGFDAAKLLELIKRYKRYIAAGVLFVAMVVVLAKCTGPVTEDLKNPLPDEQETNNADLTEEFEVDAIPEVNQLIGDYYAAYAAGDVTALEAIAQPISETEKSYIKIFSEYVESYNNLSCYTKSGLNNGEYVVSVYLEMKFKDIETAAPGLDFFYLRTNESGKLYIDNAYSQFNQSNMEESTEADIQALINEFEQAEDVLTLQANVQQKYEDAIAADPDLDTMANEVIPNAIKEWIQSLTQAIEEPAEPADETDQPDDGQTQDGEDNSQEEEPQDNEDENSDGEAKTAYTMDGINLRKSPSTDDAVVIQIPLGSEIEIYPDTEKDGWIKATYDGKKGYVKREYVTTNRNKVPSGTETPEEDQPAKALPEGAEITLTDTVNVRVSMSETAAKVGQAYVGDVVKVIMSYAEGWTKVEWNGKTGYIKTELIK